MDNTYAIISKLNKYMGDYIIKELEKKGINNLVVSHGAILKVLYELGDMNFKDIANKIRKSPQTITTLIKKLQKEGYVDYKISEQDKRNKLVTLTDKGKQVIPIMDQISKELYTKQYLGLSVQEITQCRNILSKMEQNFKE